MGGFVEKLIARGEVQSCLSNAVSLFGRPLTMMLLAAACLGQSCGSNPLPIDEGTDAPTDELVLGFQPDPPPTVTPTIPDVTVEPPYSIQLTSSVRSGPAPLQVRFGVIGDTATLPDDAEYDWQLGPDVMQTQTATLTHSFLNPGPYSVTVCVNSPSWPSGVTRCARTSVVALGVSSTPGNLEPGAFDAMFTVTENGSVDLVLTGADPEGSPLGFSIVAQPAHGELGHLVVTDSDSATVTYSPFAGYSGFDELTFRVSDGSVASELARVVVQVVALPPATDPGTTPDPGTGSDPDPDPGTDPDPQPEPEPLPVRTVVVPSLQRVWREDTSIQGDASVDIQCARGESESCQVVVVNYGTEPLRNIDVTCTLDVSGPSGTVPSVTPFRVHYVKVRESTANYQSTLARYKNTRWEGAGWYPDALIPFTDPYTGAPLTSARYLAAGLELPAGQSQPYWLDFTAPANAQPGTYRGTVRITATGYRQEIPVSLTVWGFTLTPRDTLPMQIGTAESRIATIYGTGIDYQRLATLKERHLAALEAHRIFDVSIPKAPCDPETGVPRVDSAYLATIRSAVETRQLRVCRLTVSSSSPIPDAFGSGWEKFKTYMRGIDAMMKANSWIPPLYIYMVDEPTTQLEYSQVYQLGQFLRSEGLAIMNFVPGNLLEEDGWAPLEGSIDIWTYNWGAAWDMQSVLARQAAGERVWSYTGLGNPPYAPTWLLDSPLLDHVVPFWASWNLKLDGMLYWTAILESQKWGVDPWVDPATMVYPDGLGGSLAMNGEACLLMPGLPAGVDGPLPTIRLKAIRDGLDAYGYLQLLADRGGQAVSDEVARSVAASHREWNHDYRASLAARVRLAQEILARQ